MLAATLDAVPTCGQADKLAHGAALTSTMPTRATIIAVVGVSVGLAASHHRWSGVASKAANGWRATAGSWNGCWLGSPASATSPPATSYAPTLTAPLDSLSVH